MKRADLVVGVVMLLLSLLALYESSKMPMVYGTGPGRGFLPYWLSLIVALLSAVLIVSAVRRSASEDKGINWPRGHGLRLIGVTMVGLLAYSYLISVVGYILSTLAFVWLVVHLLGSYRWYWSGATGLAVGLALYLVFQVWLGMQLPTGLLIIP